MKYMVVNWSRGNPDGFMAHGAYSIIADTPGNRAKNLMFGDVHHYAVFPFAGTSLKCREDAELLADKMCAFLNERDEKMAQVLELMKIAAT